MAAAPKFSPPAGIPPITPGSAASRDGLNISPTWPRVVSLGPTEHLVVLGLCVGHDSLFFRYSDAPATVLVAKDRVLAHNPIGALQLADSYYSRVWGPDRPAKAPKIPAEGRRKA